MSNCVVGSGGSRLPMPVACDPERSAAAQHTFRLSRLVELRRHALVAAALGGRDQWFDMRPFIVGQVTRISQFAAVVTSAVLRHPHRWCPSRIRSPLLITNDSKDSKCFRTDTKIVSCEMTLMGWTHMETERKCHEKKK